MAASCGDVDAERGRGNNSRKSKPSRRIIAARHFLKNISLDGKSNYRHAVRACQKGIKNENIGTLSLARPSWPRQVNNAEEDDEEKELISALSVTSKVQLHHCTSVASTHIYKENAVLSPGGDPCNLPKSKSYSDTSSVSSGREKQQSFVTKQSVNIRIVDSRLFLNKATRYMKDKRALLISHNGLPFGSMSVRPYKKQEKNNQSSKEKRTSAVAHQTSTGSVTLAGVEVGDIKRTVSYSHLLVPVVFRKRKFTDVHVEGLDESNIFNSRDFGDSILEHSYHPFLLDDPELTSGRHRKVLNLKSYSVSIIQYAKQSEIKKDINERFKENFPNANITLSKLRSIKMDMFEVGMKIGIDRATIACSHVYFEKLVFKEKITKANRKYCAAACLLLASKFNGDIKKDSISSVIETIVDGFRLHLKELLASELLVLIALEFQLCLPASEVNPMYKRLESMRTIVKSRNRHSHRSQHNSRNNYRNRNETN